MFKVCSVALLAPLILLSNISFASFESNDKYCGCVKEITKTKNCEILNNRKYSFKRHIFNDVHSIDEVTINSLANYYIKNSDPDIFQVAQARNALSKLYICSGFINSGVLLENYDEKEKVATFKVIKGKLEQSEISVETVIDKGSNRFTTPRLVRKYLVTNSEDALSSGKLRENLEFLRRKPQIKNVNATLLPGETLGSAKLDLVVTENPRNTTQIILNNNKNPSIGSFSLGLNGRYNSLFIEDSYLDYSVAFSEGLKDFSLGYTWNNSNPNISWNIATGQATSTVTDSVFQSLDITGETRFLSLSSTYHAKRTYSIEKEPEVEEVNIISNFNLSKNTNTILGRSFSFTNGEIDGVTNITSFSVGAEWKKQKRSQASRLYGGLEFGLDIFGSTINIDKPGSNYTILTGQYSSQKSLDSSFPSKIQFKANAQLTNDELLSSKKLALGGYNSVRGYRQGTSSVDKGFSTSVELHIPISNRPLFDKQPGDGKISLIPFIDLGYGINNDSTNKNETKLASLGIGFNWNLGRKINIEAFLAQNLLEHNIDETKDSDWQDKGFHFQITGPLGW